MNHRIATRACGFLVVLALAGVAGWAGVVADEEELPPIERLKKDLLGIQKNLTNAKGKLKRGIGGVSSTGPEGQGAERRPTPAQSCCGSNIERINMKIHMLTRTLEELQVHYVERENAEALAALDQIHAELNVVARGVAIFKMAGTRERAEQAMTGLIRPFNRLREAIDRLAACCPVDADAPSKVKQRP
jgi:hypothetical protein